MLNRIKTAIIDACLWFFWFPFRSVMRRLPWKVVYFIGDLSAYLIYLFAPGIRRLTERELRHCLGGRISEKKLKTAVRMSFSNDVKRRIDDLTLTAITTETIDERVTYEGLGHIDEALKQGRGAIILLSHFGSYMMILPALGLKGYRINQIGGVPNLKHHRPINERIFKLKEKDNSCLPVNFIRSDIGAKTVIDALKRNELVAIAFDGREGSNFIETEVFGKTAYVGQGPVRFAMMTGAVILPTFIIRGGDDTQRLVIEKPYELCKMGSRDETVSYNLLRLAGIFEGYILKYPEHFGMILSIHRIRSERHIIDRPFIA